MDARSIGCLSSISSTHFSKNVFTVNKEPLKDNKGSELSDMTNYHDRLREQSVNIYKRYKNILLRRSVRTEPSL